MERFTNALIAAAVLLAVVASLAGAAPLWLRYPAMSPDGKQIAFAYRGDLYLVDAAGGVAVPLTQHAAHDVEPVWSPDGQRMVFRSDRYGNFDLFILSLNGGRTQRLTWHSAHDYPGAFSPDGQSVYFSSQRLDAAKASGFPSWVLPELYRVPVDGGQPRQVLSTPAEAVAVASDGRSWLYQDRKGYEDIWRKHHTSSVARDIWRYTPDTGTHTQLTSFEGEDRNPVWGDNGDVFFLSERSGTFNIWRSSLSSTHLADAAEPLTHFGKHPVRFLSRADTGLLCFTWHGELYTLMPGEAPRKVPIRVITQDRVASRAIRKMTIGATDIALSPNDAELALIVRGDIFVTSVAHKVTRQVTATPEQERSVSFSPDGRALLYASERGGSWNLYRSTLVRQDEKRFYLATQIDEEAVLATRVETFQPAYSPDGKEVAYLEERTTLRVLNLESRQRRTILDGQHTYSYRDGDQHYAWSPDGAWFAVKYFAQNRWSGEVGLASADSRGPVRNLTHSGYGDWYPQWARSGDILYWVSNRHGKRSHGSWGSDRDIYALFLTQDAYDRFRLTKEEYELLREEDKKTEGQKAKKSEPPDKEPLKPIEIDFDGLVHRRARLTVHSSDLKDAIMSSVGDRLYYLSRFEKGHDLWVQKFKERETKLLAKFKGRGLRLLLDSEGKLLYVLTRGKSDVRHVFQVNANSGKKTLVKFEAEQVHDAYAERAYLFEHVWRQVKKKFYVTDLHGVDWDFYKQAYAPFLPHINNNYDFAEMLSEMLGELNASHTGARYRPRPRMRDQTASLGLYFDPEHQGLGLKVQEVMPGGPAQKADAAIKPGIVIQRIDGQLITSRMNVYALLNRKAKRRVLLRLYDPDRDKSWDAVIKPVSRRDEWWLVYKRWVKKRREQTEALSNGRIGYVCMHVRRMRDDAFREVYSDIFGRHNDKEALIVDTRFNGGGWLHDDLAVLLSGRRYLTFSPRGQENLGGEPRSRWHKPSAVLIGEGNYSDAHMFPYAYKALDIGPLIGMPVPGTATAVWWERLRGRALVFGIPQVGMKTLDGRYLENTQLEPDIRVANDPASVGTGRDPQLEKAVQVLLEQLDAK